MPAAARHTRRLVHASLVAGLAFLPCVDAAAQAGRDRPGVQGFGLARPDTIPEPFAPDLVARMRITRTPVFGPDGREMVWSTGVGAWRSILLRARFVDGAWRGPDTLGFSTGEYFDHNPALSPDGRRLVFASNRPIVGKPATTIPGTPVPTSDLFVSERTGDGWTPPIPLGPEINTTADEDVPVVTRAALYFGSSRSGGPGQGRIYRARRVGRAWTAPEPLPAPVTSGAGELLNHVAPDESYVVFHSMAAGDAGGLLIAFRRTDGGWDTPLRLSEAIRSLRGYFLNVTPDGRWLLFTAPVAGGTPRIYRADARLLRAAAETAASAEVPRPDLTGTYALDRERSTLVPAVASIDSGVVRIDHRDPAFRFHRVFWRGARGDTLAYAGTTDGRAIPLDEGEVHATATLTWAGDTLVFAVEMTAPWGAATNRVRYRLLDGGRTLEARETFRGAHVSYDNVWVFRPRHSGPGPSQPSPGSGIGR